MLLFTDLHIHGMFREPTASLYVVEPGYLGFTVLPGRNWVFEVGRTYSISIELYDKEGHKIHPSEVHRLFETLKTLSNSVFHA